MVILSVKRTTEKEKKMAQKQGMITDAQIEEVREIEREFMKRGGSGLEEMMDTLIVGLRGKLNCSENDEAPRKASEEEPIQESQAGNLAKKRQQKIQGFFNNHGLGYVVVTLPNISDKEFKARQKKNQAIFFRPATKDLSYEDFMRALGQGDDWTVVDEEEKAKIGWKKAKQGYWFWTEVRAECPRQGFSWKDLIKEINPLSLEEYVLVFYTHKALTKTILDQNKKVWLRTRYRSDYSLKALAVIVDEDGGMVGFDCYDCNFADSSPGNEGGRFAEVIKP